MELKLHSARQYTCLASLAHPSQHLENDIVC